MNRVRVVATLALGLAALLSPLSAQPKPKSQKEFDAYMAIINAQDPDGRIKAVNEFLVKFADTQLKANALQIATLSAYEKNDPENVIVYGERTLEADAKNYTAMMLMSRAIAYRTREFDLDKEEKLTRAEKLAAQAIELLKTAPKPNPQIPDDQWEAGRKDYMGQSHEALGMCAMVRKKYDVAVAEFTQAQAMAMQPNSETWVQTAIAQNNLGKFDEALAAADKALADAQAPPSTRQRATEQKIKANQGKAKAAAPKP